MSGSGEAAGGGGALASATGAADGGSEAMGGGFEGRKPPEAVDYTTMTGADFQRAVGVDPVMWAVAFLQCYAQADGVRTDGHRELYVAGWFRDAMDAAVKAHAGGTHV